MDERTEALQDGYRALSGVGSLEAVARVLRDGLHTPDFLKAVAKRLDPTFDGELDECQLVLVSRDTLGPVNFKLREERLAMTTDVINTVWEAKESGALMKNVVFDLCRKWSVSKSTIYAIAKGI
jgi:hypothetical protein